MRTLILEYAQKENVMRFVRLSAFSAIIMLAVSGFAAVPNGGRPAASYGLQHPQQAAVGISPTPLAPVASGFGVMVKFGGTYSWFAGSLYQMSDSDVAAEFSGNAFTGQIECVDQTGAACAASDAPPVPAPDPAQIQRASIAQACTFLNGGRLQALNYTQVSTVSPVPYDSTWKQYTYHYSVRPASPAALAPLTGWTSVDAPWSKHEGTQAVSVSASIVNEFVVFPEPNKPMYAFMAGSFLADLQLTIRGDGVSQTLQIQQSTTQNCPGCLRGQHGAVDFKFTPNAGRFSRYTGSLADPMWQVKSGDARTILNTDGYTANDNGGASGNALQITVLRSQPITLQPGSYQLVLTGTSSGIPFEADGQLQIISPNCSIQ